MSAPKPCLGYPSRTRAVLALQSEGVPDPEIARRIGVPTATVAALAHSGSRSKRASRPAEQHGRTVLFPIDVLDRLKPDAAARGISANELARRIVEIAVEEGLIAAILDDAEGST